MRPSKRPHVLGIDDGPFEKRVSESVPLVGVTMEGADLVEAVAVTTFPVDGEGATDFLADWIGGLRVRPALQGIFFSGVTLAGLAVVDVEALAGRLGVPVLIVNRRNPENHRLAEALRAAGLEHRLAIVERTPAAFSVQRRLFAAQAGSDRQTATELVCATRRKSELPEPLRLAHLIARAIVMGESRGRP
ncbi:MAG: DUF99 family protein [Myxococcota bacterium]